VLAGHLDRPAVEVAAHGGGHLGQVLARIGRVHEQLPHRQRAVGGQVVEPGHRRRVARLQPGVVHARRQQDVLDQHDPLAPVVVGGELADHRDHRVGVALVVLGHVGQVLDLPHHVVAQVAEHAAVQRGQVRQGRGVPLGQQRLQGGQDPPVTGHRRRHRPGHGYVEAPGGQRGERVAADERPAAPAGLAVLDRFEQEAGLVAHEPGEGSDGRGEVGQQLAPHGDDRVGAGEAPELVERGSDHPSPSGPKARKKQVRAPV
jgi:hypothetical protein